MGASMVSRDNNMQKVWLRNTIPWKLSCDRETLSREDAADIFSMRLDNLALMQHVIRLAIIIILLVIGPFILFCFKKRVLNRNECLKCCGCGPIVTRSIFIVALLLMVIVIDKERVQCHQNM